MFHLPFDLPDEQLEAFRDDVSAFEERAEDDIDDMLAELDSEPARRQLDRIVFNSSTVLPKRDSRPGRVSLMAAFIVDQLYGEYGDGEKRDRLVQFTLTVEEYADMVDDLVDGDVDPDHETEVLLTLQVVWPLIVRLLVDMGEREGRYWSEHATLLVEAPFTEMTREPSAETYRTVVDRQSTLFGFVTGLAAVAADEDAETVARSERIGELFFKYTQFLLDCEQYEGDEEWNALAVMPREEVVQQLRTWREAFEAELEALPEERARRLRPMVAVDLEEYSGTANGRGRS